MNRETTVSLVTDDRGPAGPRSVRVLLWIHSEKETVEMMDEQIQKRRREFENRGLSRSWKAIPV